MKQLSILISRITWLRPACPAVPMEAQFFYGLSVKNFSSMTDRAARQIAYRTAALRSTVHWLVL